MKKKYIIILSFALLVILAVLLVFLFISQQPKVDNISPADRIITNDYPLERILMLEATYSVRSGFHAVNIKDLACETNIKLECKRQIAPEQFYYIVQGNGRRCFIFVDAEDFIQTIIATYRFPTLDEIQRLVDDTASLYADPVSITDLQTYSLKTTAYVCYHIPQYTYFCIQVQDGIVIMRRPSLTSGKDPEYYYYTYEEWPSANAAWQEKYAQWDCQYEVLPIDLIWRG